jgi:predicted regulator of Ras-like GTPase activity (Roadblock/LC7/MglB family)
MTEIREDPPPLPTRKRAARRSDLSPMSGVPAQKRSLDLVALHQELVEIRSRVDRVNGLLLASRDGLAICADTRGVHTDSVAAMAAATMGLAGQFTGQAMVGDPRAAMFEGADGHVCVLPIDSAVLLVVFGERDTNAGMFNLAAKQSLAQVQMAIRRNTSS